MAFPHGVASGDPTSDGVVLWTRAVTDAPVRWLVSRDADGADVVAEGVTRSRAEHDHTVHVAVAGLDPASTYHYRFDAGGRRSAVGRTRTAPGPGDARALRLGVAACASWPSGYFNAYARLAERDVDLVLHLGDYVYDQVSSGGIVRGDGRPAAPVTLAAYRRRHATYRSDPDLQALHARHPVVAVWDDHDIASDAWRDGASHHVEDRHGPWPQRRDAAVRAFRDWIPSTVPDPGDRTRAYRRIALGDLADVFVLDTRLAGRERPARSAGGPVLRPGRRARALLGEAQWGWLETGLRASTAAWRIVTTQVLATPFPAIRLPDRLGGGAVVNPGQWDGYPAERERLLRLLDDPAVGPTIVLSGDIHASIASELRLGGRAVAAEWTTPAVSSPPFPVSALRRFPPAARLIGSAIVRQNGHIRWADLDSHGYLVIELTAGAATAQWWHVDTVVEPSPGERRGARVTAVAGDATLSVERP